MTDFELQNFARRAQAGRREVDGLQGEMRAALMRGQELTAEVKELVELSGDLDRVSLLLNSMGEERQEQTQQRIEELVTRGLQTIFDSSLSFHIVQSTRGKAVTVDFLMRTTLDGHIVETPVLEARGGGVAVTIGFLLRLVVLLLRSGANKESLIVLDETFSMVSADYLPAVGEFLREIVDKTGVQILMVTHQDELTELADKIYRFKTVDGKTVVTENG